MRAESAGNCADRPAVQRNRVAFWSVSVIGDANDLGRLATDGGFRRRQDTPSLLYRTSVCVSKLTADGGDAGAGSWGEPLGRPWATQQVGKYISTPVVALTSPESTWPEPQIEVRRFQRFTRFAATCQAPPYQCWAGLAAAASASSRNRFSFFL